MHSIHKEGFKTSSNFQIWEGDVLEVGMGVREAHFFRRVPSELSEVTNSGGVISVGAFITICWLVLTQYNESFSGAKRVTHLRLDTPLDPEGWAKPSSTTIRINFNISMLHLPCQFAQLHVTDHVGSHKAGGVRNVHKVRLDRDGASLGLFEPHKYNAASDGKDLASHVFPWHKKEDAQGDADHREQQTKKHLSQEQRDVVVEVESTIKQAGKNAHAGRRLLALEDAGTSPSPVSPSPASPSPASPSPASPSPASPSPASPIAGSMPTIGTQPVMQHRPQPEQPKQEPEQPKQEPKPLQRLADDTSPSCSSWAGAGECITNMAYMLAACEMSCSVVAMKDPSVCHKWAEAGHCTMPTQFMTMVCPGSCPAPSMPEVRGLHAPDDPDEEKFVPPAPFNSEPAKFVDAILGVQKEFAKLLEDHPLVMVNFFAPWCFWSNKLTPVWLDVARRLHTRAWSRSVKMIQVDCTTVQGGELCRSQGVHAFPSVRIFRGSSHAYESYEYGREVDVIWLHLVKMAAEALVGEMNEIPPEQKEAELLTHDPSLPSLTTQIAHVSKDLRLVMDRRAKGLDEDWSEDALSADEEIKEDRGLLQQISEAVGSITGAKGLSRHEIMKEWQGPSLEARYTELPHKISEFELAMEDKLINERASDVVLGLLTGRAATPGVLGDTDNEVWIETETHEGCSLFGYVEVSRAPGTLHISPHASRHSFNFSAVNTTHHIDHLSFGLELSARQRARLPVDVRDRLMTLDGAHFTAMSFRETYEHHVNIMPTSYGHGTGTGPYVGSYRVETYRFTATSQGRTRDTLPHLMITYDVSPIHAHIVEKTSATTEFLVSLCAIIGGAVSLFGLVDGMLHSGTKTLKRMGGGKGY